MDERRSSSARERTKKHLAKLLATAAAASMFQGCNCGGSGYGVVDPMPAPAKCPGLAKQLRASVKVVEESGKKYHEVEITPPEGRGDVELTADVAKMGSPVPAKLVGKNLVFRVEAQKEANVLSFETRCDAGAMSIGLTINDGDGGPPTVTLSEWP